MKNKNERGMRYKKKWKQKFDMLIHSATIFSLSFWYFCISTSFHFLLPVSCEQSKISLSCYSVWFSISLSLAFGLSHCFAFHFLRLPLHMTCHPPSWTPLSQLLYTRENPTWCFFVSIFATILNIIHKVMWSLSLISSFFFSKHKSHGNGYPVLCTIIARSQKKKPANPTLHRFQKGAENRPNSLPLP